MFRAIILPIFRNTRLCVTACGRMHRRCCRPVAGNICRMRLRRILQSMQHTQGDTKERELLKCVVAVKECIRGGERHLQDVNFQTDNLDYCLLKGKL